MGKSIKSKYKPENPTKYQGNPNNIICRSSWERKFCKWADKSRDVVSWASEEFSIPYVSPKDNKVHRYYPDYLIKVRSTGKLLKSKLNITNGKAKLNLLEDEYGISPGQACVFYSKDEFGDKLLGGGWITK